MSKEHAHTLSDRFVNPNSCKILTLASFTSLKREMEGINTQACLMAGVPEG